MSTGIKLTSVTRRIVRLVREALRADLQRMSVRRGTDLIIRQTDSCLMSTRSIVIIASQGHPDPHKLHLSTKSPWLPSINQSSYHHNRSGLVVVAAVVADSRIAAAAAVAVQGKCNLQSVECLYSRLDLCTVDHLSVVPV